MLFNKLLVILKKRGITLTVLPDPGLQLVDFGAGPIIRAWDAIRLGSRPTQVEIDTVTDDEAAQIVSKYIDSRVILMRMTADERFKIFKLASYDATVCQFILLFLCRAGKVDVHDSLSKQGWAYIKTIGLAPPVESGITPIWPDAATADARIVIITA